MTAAEEVDVWLAAQDHAFVSGAQAVRETILRAAPAAEQSIKWKAPNFTWQGCDFATFNMRRPAQLQLILHTGAALRPELPQTEIAPVGDVFRWAGHNRAVITWTSRDAIAQQQEALAQVIRAWVAAL
ncbi:DUF1801 domain-containing protein [Leucobacter sp. NPDC058333]|uniref:DUF1801 domain-containing protein n=1 Tax=Leucobacter sp. NPDC058333 TaxID=3346450 RepID=UPI003650742A